MGAILGNTVKLPDHPGNDAGGVFVLPTLDQGYELIAIGVFHQLGAFVAAQQPHRSMTIEIAQRHCSPLLVCLGGRQQFEDTVPASCVTV